MNLKVSPWGTGLRRGAARVWATIEAIALRIARVGSFLLLIAAPMYFGIEGKPAEMGLAIVVGALALAFTFLDRIESFKGAGFEMKLQVRELNKKVDVMVAANTEPPALPGAVGPSTAQTSPVLTQGGFEQLPPPLTERSGMYALDSNARRVLKALGNEKFQWRRVPGIQTETSLSAAQVRTVLRWLNSNHFAVSTRGRDGGLLWGLLPDGRTLLSQVRATEAAQQTE